MPETVFVELKCSESPPAKMPCGAQEVLGGFVFSTLGFT